MGRPPKRGKKIGGRLEIRVDDAEKAAYDQAAERAGVDRSDWIRATLNEAAKEALKRKPSAP